MASQFLGDRGIEALRRRRLLRVSVKLACLAGVVVFVVVFLQGMPGPGRVAAERIDPESIPPGTARLEVFGGRPVWIVHRTDQQLRALVALDDHVFDPGPDEKLHRVHRSLDERHGVYLAETARQGILIQYLQARPDRLAPGTPWHGGFIDPASGALFDTAGRRYRSTSGAPLSVPPHRYVGGEIQLGGW